MTGHANWRLKCLNLKGRSEHILVDEHRGERYFRRGTSSGKGSTGNWLGSLRPRHCYGWILSLGRPCRLLHPSSRLPGCPTNRVCRQGTCRRAARSRFGRPLARCSHRPGIGPPELELGLASGGEAISSRHRVEPELPNCPPLVCRAPDVVRPLPSSARGKLESAAVGSAFAYSCLGSRGHLSLCPAI